MHVELGVISLKHAVGCMTSAVQFLTLSDPVTSLLAKPAYIKCALSGMVVRQGTAMTLLGVSPSWLLIIANWSDVMLLRVFLHAKDSWLVELALQFATMC